MATDSVRPDGANILESESEPSSSATDIILAVAWCFVFKPSHWKLICIHIASINRRRSKTPVAWGEANRGRRKGVVTVVSTRRQLRLYGLGGEEEATDRRMGVPWSCAAFCAVKFYAFEALEEFALIAAIIALH